MRGVIMIILLWLLPLSMGQVVQPTWLMRPDQLPNAQAAEVRVTPEKLKQAADIRASIQKAVNDGTYVVASSP
ncbi:CG17169, partial [Drosophila busckii]